MAGARLPAGGGIVSREAYNCIDADIVNMEMFGLMRACQCYRIPLLAIRGISDNRGEVTKFSFSTVYLDIIDDKLASGINTVFRSLEDGSVRI
jgi:adenosylhomocysteine nucleosidase